MKKLKLIIILAVVVYVVWKYVLKKPVPEIPPLKDGTGGAGDPNNPIQKAEQAILDLEKAIEQNFPGQQQAADEIIEEVRNALDQAEQLRDDIRERYQQDMPILTTDQAVPTIQQDPYREFVSISTPLVRPVNTSPLYNIKQIRLTTDPGLYLR